MQAPSAPAPEPVAERGPHAVALYDYEASEENELSFTEGDEIEEIEFPSEEWWSGKNVRTGDVGLFPGVSTSYGRWVRVSQELMSHDLFLISAELRRVSRGLMTKRCVSKEAAPISEAAERL